jgi:hypothetical protein
MQTGSPAPLLADDVNDIIQRNADRLNAAIHYERDFEYVGAFLDQYGIPALPQLLILQF